MSKQKKDPAIFDFSKDFDVERLVALERFMRKKGQSLEKELCVYLEKLYQRHVPKEVKEYLDYDGEEAPDPSQEGQQRGSETLSEDETEGVS